MRARSLLRLLIMTIPAAALLHGCGPETTAARDDLTGADDGSVVRRDPPSAAAEASADSADGTSGRSAAEIAAQIDRDMAEFARMQQGDGLPGEQTTETASDQPDALAESPDRRIRWNDTPVRRTTRRSPSAGDPKGDATGASPEQPAESVTPSALFRDPTGDVKVNEPPESESSAGDAEASRRSAIESDPLDLLLVDLRRALFRRSIDSDQPIRPLLAIASLSLIDPELQMPAGTERDLSEREVELLRRFHDFCSALGSELDAEHDAESTIVGAVEDFRRSLIDERLELPAVEMCWSVEGFGNYEPFDRRAFLAHNEDRFILYLEIDGFRSETNDKGQWVTEVAQQLEIISDRDGIPVWSEPWQTAVDVTSKKRRDFFTTQIITIPKALSVGSYHLKVRVRDERSSAEAEASIPFEMVADPKRAARIPR